MKITCPWFQKKKNIALFDNGLRIESGLNILQDNKVKLFLSIIYRFSGIRVM